MVKTFLSLIAVAGIVACLLLNIILIGENPWVIFHPAELLLIVGGPLFGLLFIAEGNLGRFILGSFKVLFGGRCKNNQLADLAVHGWQLTLAFGTLAFLTATVDTLLSVADGPWRCSQLLGAAFTAIYWAILIGCVGFRLLEIKFREAV